MNRSAALKLVLACTALGVAATAHAAPSPEQQRQAAILRFAKSKLGQHVGDGGCSELASAALDVAGARPLKVYKTSPKLVKLGHPEETCDWGRLVVSKSGQFNYEPGMILQFENCEFRKPDGSAWWSFPHHTAIIKSAKGSVVTLLHQNAPIGGPVVELTLDMAWLQRGPAQPAPGKAVVLNLYRPLAP